jgi:hypothetical protein
MRGMRFLAVAIVSALGSAQQHSSAPSLPSTSETTQVPVQMRRIVDALAGTWSVTWIDKDGKVIGRGEEVWKIAPGGSAFIEENRSLVNGKPAEDHAAMWWDSKAHKVHGIWCDATINDEGCSGFDVVLAGSGNDIVLTGVWEDREKVQAWKEVFSSTGDALTQTLQIGDPGKDLRLAGTIRATKR